MTDVLAIIADMCAEGDELDRLVADLPRRDWAAPTPAVGWSIAHQIAHLAWTDEQAIMAATDPAGFGRVVRVAADDPEGFVEAATKASAQRRPPEILDGWRRGRSALAEALRLVEPGTKLPWFGPPMSAASMATARIMETWAHGQDVTDALGVKRPATARLRHVAHIGVRTRDFGFRIRGLEPPAEPFHVALRAPDGDTWTWGPSDAAQRVEGSALDFCLLVVQRRNRRDLDLTSTGPDADKWLDIAQAFAGPPGPGRE